MKRKQTVLVAGEVTIETTLAADGFPLDYQPVRFPFFGMSSEVAGVGVNQCAAHAALGRPTRLLGLVGKDLRADMVRSGLAQRGIDDKAVLGLLAETTQSLVVYDPSGRRMIFNDLKDIQDAVYPEKNFVHALDGCAAAVLCNLNFVRPFLPLARARGIPVASDVHVLSDPDDAYNRDFMAAADLLFISNEHFRGREHEFGAELARRYSFGMLIIGMGGDGALLWERTGNTWHHSPAYTPRPVVNTVGAGDALSACFLDGLLDGLPPPAALDRACRFAGWKVGARSAAEGFPRLEDLAAG